MMLKTFLLALCLCTVMQCSVVHGKFLGKPSRACGSKNQRCCSQAADGPACRSDKGGDLACDRCSRRSKCKPCGEEGQLACNPKDYNPRSQEPLYCNGKDLEPVKQLGKRCKERYVCKKVTKPTCGTEGVECCSQAADGPACDSGLNCVRKDPTDGENLGKCAPCGAEDQQACNPCFQSPFGPCDLFCNPGLVPVATPGAPGSEPLTLCVVDTSGEPCGKKGIECCSQAADGPACDSGLNCVRKDPTDGEDLGTCAPCGAEDQQACNPCFQSPFGPCDPFCNPGLFPAATPGAPGSELIFFCVPDTSGGGEPSCPGKEGERCCTFIADAGPCESGAICNSVETGTPVAEGTCISCGGLDELACFEVSLLGTEGPLCDEGLTPTETKPPRCVNGDSEPSCPGLLGEPCCTFIADASPCVGGTICNGPTAEGFCEECGDEGQLACFTITIAGESGPICDEGLRSTVDEPPRCSKDGTGPKCTGIACPSATTS